MLGYPQHLTQYTSLNEDLSLKDHIIILGTDEPQSLLKVPYYFHCLILTSLVNRPYTQQLRY